jgi:hypothetical protein
LLVFVIFASQKGNSYEFKLRPTYDNDGPHPALTPHAFTNQKSYIFDRFLSRSVARRVSHPCTRGSHDLAIVGAPGDDDDDDQAYDSGAVYLFRLQGNQWQPNGKLLASDRTAYDEFGSSLAVDGNVVIVGVPRKNYNGFDSGVAYLFRQNGNQWQEQKIVANDADHGDNFGLAVSVSGDTAIVGAPNDDDQGSSSGAAYIFRWNGSSWQQEQKIVARPAAGSRVTTQATQLPSVMMSPSSGLNKTRKMDPIRARHIFTALMGIAGKRKVNCWLVMELQVIYLAHQSP